MFEFPLNDLRGMCRRIILSDRSVCLMRGPGSAKMDVDVAVAVVTEIVDVVEALIGLPACCDVVVSIGMSICKDVIFEIEDVFCGEVERVFNDDVGEFV